MNQNQIYEKLIEKYGELQLVVAIEELGELQKELCKTLRGKEKKEAVIEEMADVYIMLDQLKLIYDIPSPVIRAEKNKKLLRTKERLEKDNL